MSSPVPQDEDTPMADESFSSIGSVLGASVGDSDLDEDDDGTITLTPRQLIERIMQGWINEKESPELLPPLADEKEAVLSMVKTMEKNVSTLDKSDIRTGIHKLELERIRYCVVSYLRQRLFKIQDLCWFYHDQEMKRKTGEMSILMPEEVKFLKEYLAATHDYLKEVVATNFPQPLQQVDPKKCVKLPHKDTFVFFRSKQDLEVLVDDAFTETHAVSVHMGDQYIMRYAPLASLVSSDQIGLI